jgi:hypothetical protein
MPYQGDAGGAGSGGTVRMPAQAPPDLGTGVGGLMQIGTTQVVGQSGTSGANVPVDAIEQASAMVAQGKADLGQTVGAEHRLDGFDGVGGGGGNNANNANNADNAAQPAAATATQNVSQSGMGGNTSVQNAALTTGPGGLDPRSQATGAITT